MCYVPTKFSRFCMLDKQDCLQLLGFLPEQSKAKVQIISNQSDFRMILFSKTAKIHQKTKCTDFRFLSPPRFQKIMYFCHQVVRRIGGSNHLLGREQLRVFSSSCSIDIR